MRKVMYQWVLRLAMSTVSILGTLPPAMAADDCNTAVLTGAATLPVSDISNVNVSNSNLDFSGGGCGAETLGADRIICFTPENFCQVNVACNGPLNGGVYIDQVAACLQLGADGCSAFDVDETGGLLISNFTLNAGSQYCFACKSNQNNPTNEQLDLVITAAGGTDCGTLPVGLESFVVE